jgi:ketosteroid isomerase-like protein
MPSDRHLSDAHPSKPPGGAAAMERLGALVKFFESITADDISRFRDFYAEDAFFKDPFNEVRGATGIANIFAHMFRTLDEPRFRVREQFRSRTGAMLLWDFHFQRGGKTQTIRGASHLRFDADGKIDWHRDYWDPAEELYFKLPVLGSLMRALQRRLAAPR